MINSKIIRGDLRAMRFVFFFIFVHQMSKEIHMYIVVVLRRKEEKSEAGYGIIGQ